jgi:hypothetical protein
MLDIAGIRMGIDTRDKMANTTLEPFCSSSTEMPEISVFFSSADVIPEPDSRLLLDDKIKWYSSLADRDDISICIYKPCTNEISSIMHVDQQWENAIITYVGCNPENKMIAGPLGEILFRNNLLFNEGIMIHAAAIEWEGKGIMFSAPSGTGKSTQADLWKLYKGAAVLNGDRSIVRMHEEQAFVYGSPWCGSSGQYLNKRSPLSAIVILKQAKKNELRLLDEQEALFYLLPRCFLPYYDDGGEVMDNALKILAGIIMTTRVFLLKCRPDKEAVEMVYECVR